MQSGDLVQLRLRRANLLSLGAFKRCYNNAVKRRYAYEKLTDQASVVQYKSAGKACPV